MKTEWRLRPHPPWDADAEALGLPQYILRILSGRGMTDAQSIEAFLRPMDADMPSARLLPDLSVAVDVLASLAESKGRVRIVGDYDQDGVAATVILWTAFRDLGLDADYRIPHRLQEGYGLAKVHVEEAVRDGVELIVTCDNGIQSFEAIAFAQECGIEVIVTDHHRILRQNGADVLPDALANINPTREDSPYPNRALCGAGVAWKLADALYTAQGKKIPSWLIGLAAMGTVCDVVDLTGENRTIVVKGLAALNASGNIGLAALKEAAALRGPITAYALGFVIGPAVNAAGRLDDASVAVELFLTDDPDEAMRYAKRLTEWNRDRRRLTEEGAEQATAQWEEDESLPRVLCLYLPDVHESVLGIVAGRLRDATGRPTILFTDSREADILKGSGRSVPEYPLTEALDRQKDLLERYGGHDLAAGVSVHRQQFAALREALQDDPFAPEEPIRVVQIDFPMQLRYVTVDMAQTLARLEPFGKGNPKPLFASRQVTLAGISVIGKEKNTLRLRFVQDGKEFTGILFRRAEEILTRLYRKFGFRLEDAFEQTGLALTVDIVYTPELNEFAGQSRLQLMVADLR